jgi:hypothetical protein
MRDTPYATELATADLNGCRIERLHVKEQDQDEIRFSWWVDGRMANRPLDLPENELLPLLRLAIEQGVFTEAFLRDLHSMLYDVRGENL